MHLLKKYFNKFLFRFISELIMITYGNFIDKFKDIVVIRFLMKSVSLQKIYKMKQETLKINKLPRLCQISKFFDLSNFAFKSRNKNLEEKKMCSILNR